MATYEITAPDGNTYSIEGPEGATKDQVVAAILAKNPSAGRAPSTERTWGEAAKDVGAGVVSGVGSLVQLPGQLYGLATGDMSKTGALGAGEKISEYGEEMKSAGLKAREQARAQKIAEAAKEGQLSALGTALGETIKDPALLTSFFAEQAPQLLVPFGAGRAAAFGAKALGAGAEAAGVAGTRAAIGAGSVQQGADIGAGAYENIYNELKSKGASDEDAAAGAINLARASGASGAILSLLANKLPGASKMEEVLAGVPGKGSRLVSGAQAALGELPSEVLEETGGRFAQNVAMRQVKPEQSLTEGLGETAAMAALGAVGMGGATGLMQRQQREQEKPEPIEQPKVEQPEYTPPTSLTGRTPAQMFEEQGRENAVGQAMMDAVRARQEQEAQIAEEQRKEQEQRQQEAMERARNLQASVQANADLLEESRRRAEEQQKIEAKRLAAEQKAEVKRQAEERTAISEATYSSDPVINELRRADALKTFDASIAPPKIEAPKPVEIPKVPEYKAPAPITKTGIAGLMGEAPAGGDLANIISQRRIEEEKKAPVPMTGGYEFLQREKQRLSAEEQTPEVKTLVKRIDDRMGELLVKDIEQQRKDKELGAKSAFGQEELPPVESRDVVVGGQKLAELQAPVRPAEEKATAKDIRAFEKIQGQPAPTPELETQIAEAEKAKGQIKSLDLSKVLAGKLAPDEVADIAPRGTGFKSLSSGTKPGTYISELVADGSLNDFLPPDQHPGATNFDAERSAEDIKQKLRDKELKSFDAQIESRKLEGSIAEMQAELGRQKQMEVEISEASKEELPDFKRSEKVSQSIGKDAVQSIVDSVKGQMKNAPEVVVAESMNDSVIPQEVRAHNEEQVAKGAAGSPQGFFYKGKAYVIADQVSTPGQAVEAMLHEVVGHYGLRGAFGAEMSSVLADVVKHRKADVEAKAKEYGFDVNKKEDMLRAAEEVLAEVAQKRPSMPFVRRAISAIRNWLRDNGFKIKMSDADIIQKFIVPAQKFVQSGAKTEVKGEAAFIRKEDLGKLTEKAKGKAKQALQKRAPINIEALSDVDPDYVAELGKVFNPESKTVVDRIDGMKDRFWQRFSQGVADQYRSIKEYSQDAYMLARISKSIDGALEGLLFHGQVFNDGGALNIRQNTKGLMKALEPVGKETDRYMMWVAMNRDARMPGEKRSIDPDLTARRDELIRGTINGKPRSEVYQAVLRDMNQLNKSVLDVALKAGLIDQKGYDKFSSDIFYIPFYRAMEDGDLQGVQTATGLTNQQFSKELKGGEKMFGDLMENTLRNWSHILSASMKNQAAEASLKAGLEMQAVVPNLKAKYTMIDGKVHSTSTGEMVDDGELQEDMTTSGKGTVKVMENGKPVYYQVIDPLLLEAITSIGYMGPKSKFLDVARDFKNILQFGVTASPAFKVRNLFRDSISAMAISDLKKNPFANIIDGWVATDQNNPAHISALAGGAIFNFGSAYEGDQAKLVKRLLQMGVKENQILDTEEKIKSALAMTWRKYQDWGNKSEAANRMALYNQLRERGMSHLEASFQARDLLDFSMQGAWPAFRLLTQTIPFLNARVQGLYKLGRDGVNPTARVIYNTVTGEPIDASDKVKAQAFATVSMAVALASLALYFAFKDDEDFQKRDAWDRDNFWWFKLPGMEYAFRIPKPFEIGAFGTIVERTAEQIFDQGAEGAQFEESLRRMMGDTFALNPIPQFVKPLVDLYANKDSFTGAPIESAGMERLSKAERITDTTSPLAIALGGAVNAALPEKMEMSPVQMEYAIKGYFGWLGGTASWFSNYAVMPFSEGTKPDNKWVDTLSAGFLKSLPSNQSRYITAFYENSNQISQAYADMRHYAEIGDSEKVAQILEEKGDKIALAKMYEKTSKDMGALRNSIRQITNDKSMDGETKREQIDRMKELISMLAEQAEEVRKSMKN